MCIHSGRGGRSGICEPSLDVEDSDDEMLIDLEVRAGFLVEAYCADIPPDLFISACNSICFQINTPRTFHGLKRIWEFLDERGLHMGIERDKDTHVNRIDDASLMAYLFDPDSGREVE